MWKMWKKSSNCVAKNSKFNQNIEIIYTVTVGFVRCDKLGLKNTSSTGLKVSENKFSVQTGCFAFRTSTVSCVGNWFIVSVTNGDTVGF